MTKPVLFLSGVMSLELLICSHPCCGGCGRAYAPEDSRREWLIISNDETSGDKMESKTIYWVIYDLLLDLGHIKPIAYGLGDLNGCLVERTKQW